MLGDALFQRSAWAGLIGSFLDHSLSLHGLLATVLALAAPLTVRPAAEEEHAAMTLAGLGALAGSALAAASTAFMDLWSGTAAHGPSASVMIAMGASMGGMLGGGWHLWRWRRHR
ncbi:hypothetical protein E1B22_11460 [Thermaerobacter sp. FW80]|uniref:hypothetical protein n=1 Tax=Thermaerobacter sp. FW80 TaxID=2546351 RepID=UPI001074D446|nr:hypothetical protein [Thermaerobacter sp. FW80]QBS38259.1 hypothetical protein E1B22_11460 [Thermaerobacter sp. FW80]